MTYIIIGEFITFFIGVLLSVAFLTIAERKTMGYMQRRIGPNYYGQYGLLQAIADAVKLLLKEIIVPFEADKFILLFSPFITLILALYGWILIPLGPGITLFDNSAGIILALTISSVSIFGILLSGWASNNKFSFLATIRSTAQLISYELILTSIYILCFMFTSGTLNFSEFIEYQNRIWFVVPFLPLALIFFIAGVAETNRPPFDLVEAESELVSGFFTEYSAAPFVFFFLAEYSNLFLMSVHSVILFFGGYLLFSPIILNIDFKLTTLGFVSITILFSLFFIIKSIIFMFTYVWIRASFPRFTFDRLIRLCWSEFLPLLFSVFFSICSLYVVFNLY